MKFVFALAFIALAFALAAAQDSACDPDGNGEPSCAGKAAGTFRNNWDPTHYWECSGGQVQTVECPTNSGFDPTSKACVSWSEWKWVQPCSESS